MRDDLERVLADLLAKSAEDGAVDIDDFAEAFGALAISNDDIEAVLIRYEGAGGILAAPEGGGGAERLRTVLVAARELTRELGRRPSAAEIATKTGLSVAHVRQALALGQAMGR